MKGVILGTVRTRDQAAAVVDELRRSGVAVEDISVLFSDPTDTRAFAHDVKMDVPQAAERGDVAGGAVAVGTLGLITGIILLGFPGPGTVMAAGPIAVAIAAFATAAAGRVAGAIRALGVPREEAHWYAQKLKHGAVVVGVHTDDRAATAALLQRLGLQNLSEPSATPETVARAP